MKFPQLNRKVIFYLALTSFVLLIIVQSVWLSNTFQLKEKEFDERVKNTLRFFNNDFQDNTVASAQMKALWENHTTPPQIEGVIKYTVDTCFQRNNLPTDYVIGLGMMKKKDIFWTNNPSYSKELNESPYSIIALCMSENGAYQMKFFFPNKKNHILASLTPLLLFSSFSFLVLFLSFIGLVYMLKKQAKLSVQKNDFINNMTHELKTPLFTVSIASRMLAEQDNKQEPKHSKYIESIQQEVKRLNNLVEKILQTSLLDQKKINLEKKEMNLHQAITRAVEGFELIQAEKGGSIQLQLDASSHHIEADETHIVNSIYNLLDNAFKYSTERPQIIISTKNVGDNISLCIKDNGIGFDSETKELVFERFFRAHTGNLHNVKGYGIGLSYVKSVVEAHNGMISVNSRLNKGSEFTLQLPLH